MQQNKPRITWLPVCAVTILVLSKGIEDISAAPIILNPGIDPPIYATDALYSNISLGNGYTGSLEIYSAVFAASTIDKHANYIDPFDLRKSTTDNWTPTFTPGAGSAHTVTPLTNYGYLYLFEIAYNGQIGINNLQIQFNKPGENSVFQWGTFDYAFQGSNTGCAPNLSNPQLNTSNSCGVGFSPVSSISAGVNGAFPVTVNISNLLADGSTTHLFGFSSLNLLSTSDISAVISGNQGPNGPSIPTFTANNITPGSTIINSIPEIDAASSSSALTLLLGSLALMGERRRRKGLTD